MRASQSHHTVRNISTIRFVFFRSGNESRSMSCDHFLGAAHPTRLYTKFVKIVRKSCKFAKPKIPSQNRSALQSASKCGSWRLHDRVRRGSIKPRIVLRKRTNVGFSRTVRFRPTPSNGTILHDFREFRDVHEFRGVAKPVKKLAMV